MHKQTFLPALRKQAQYVPTILKMAKVQLITAVLIMACTVTQAAQPVPSNSPLSPSEFAAQTNEINMQNQNQYQQELNRKLGQIQKPAPAEVTEPSATTGSKDLYWKPENNSAPAMQQQRAVPTAPSGTPASTAPATTTIQPFQATPTAPQSQVYMGGFQSQGGGTNTGKQKPAPKPAPNATTGGGWNINY